MLILAVNAPGPPSHDAAVAVVRDRTLLCSLEAEKDSFRRYSVLEPTTLLSVAQYVDESPDVIALGGGGKDLALGNVTVGAGYVGIDEGRLLPERFFGHEARMFTSSHERSHIMMAVGMAPPNDSDRHAVLVWEGGIGSLYVLDERWKVTLRHHVMTEPGNRFAFLYGLADPSFPDKSDTRPEDAGKLMALAAYGDPADADPQVARTVERILAASSLFPAAPGSSSKGDFRDSPLYNAGVESQLHKNAAALITDRIFEIFAVAAQQHLPADIPLYISGGCGLNCDWNVKWRELGYFSSVFVPPCTNDSGSAIGTAIDALYALSGDPHIDWSVYAGLEFDWDREPDPVRWPRRKLDESELAATLTSGQVVAWVQGRWEIGPRALGNRSLLAEPFDPRTKDRLNVIKQREDYRPIAPCCRLEDAGKLYDDDAPDPHMLFFRRALTDRLGAVTHVDGSARVQTVTSEDNERLYKLLSAFSERHGVGVLCNTSLNFKGFGFINRMSDLVKYCETQGIPEMVVGDAWFTALPLPPGRGPGFYDIGRRFVDQLAEHGGLKPGQRVLDVGSGLGRMALHLAAYIGPEGSYEGFDIAPERVQWCIENLANGRPNVRFLHADVFHEQLNAGGAVAARDYRFPYPDEDFDYVISAVLLSSMAADEVAHYVEEAARVLKPGGRFAATFSSSSDGPADEALIASHYEKAGLEIRGEARASNSRVLGDQQLIVAERLP